MTPIYETIRIHHVQSAYFHTDETRWKVFAEKRGIAGIYNCSPGKTRWSICSTPRSHVVPQSHFPDDVQDVFTVYRYSGYKAIRHVKDRTLVLAFSGHTCIVTLCESVKATWNSKRGLCSGSVRSTVVSS